MIDLAVYDIVIAFEKDREKRRPNRRFSLLVSLFSTRTDLIVQAQGVLLIAADKNKKKHEIHIA